MNTLRRYPLAAYLGITFAVSCGLGIPLLMTAGMLPNLAARAYIPRLLVTWGPAIAALVVTHACEPRIGPRRLLATLRPTRYVMLALPVAACALVLTALAAAVSGIDPAPLLASPAALAVHLGLQLICIGLGEELGWRGWLLPHFLDRGHSRLRATALTGLIWTAWHLPVLLSGARTALAFTVGALGLSMIFTWLWIASNRSTLLIAAAHASVNAPFAVLEQHASGPPVQETLRIAMLAWGVIGAALLAVRWSWFIRSDGERQRGSTS